MMYYKVKVNNPELMGDKVTTDGYLKYNDDTPWLYTRGEAIKKAKMFGGKIELDETIPTIANSSMVVISGNELLFGIKEFLKGRDLFGSTDVESINSFIYKGTIFLEIFLELQILQKENEDFKIKDDIRDQLNELVLLATTEYILINDMCFS